MLRGLNSCLTVAAALLLSACAPMGYTLLPTVELVALAGSGLQVSAPAGWNRAPTTMSPSKHAELWTRDGVVLNHMILYAGVPVGEPLFREQSRREETLPRVRAAMLPNEIAELYERSYRTISGSTLFEITVLAPARLGGQPAVQFDYDFVLPGDEVKRKGRGVGLMAGDELHLLVFQAAALHYFDRDLPAFDAMVNSARFAGAPTN